MRLVFVLWCVLWPALVHAQSGEYEVIQVDPAGSSFTAEANKQLRTFRVRPGIEVTINGVKATFAQLEVGMKVNVTSAEPGLATKLVANGLQTKKAASAGQAVVLAPGAQPERELDAEIKANSAAGFSLGVLPKGTKVMLQYQKGVWKSWGNIATENPDSEKSERGDASRLVISLPSRNGKAGKTLTVVPFETAKRPFVYEVPVDFPDLVLRINDTEGSFEKNPGKVEYHVKVFPAKK
jgi:hypothetical protein